MTMRRTVIEVEGGCKSCPFHDYTEMPKPAFRLECGFALICKHPLWLKSGTISKDLAPDGFPAACPLTAETEAEKEYRLAAEELQEALLTRARLNGTLLPSVLHGDTVGESRMVIAALTLAVERARKGKP